jgi:hypothetical protein
VEAVVGAGFIKKKFSNAGKFALAFSIFSAQLLPIHQAAHAEVESVTFRFTKIDDDTFTTRIDNLNWNDDEPHILAWQAFLAPNKVLDQPRERLSQASCELFSLNGEAVTYSDGSNIYATKAASSPEPKYDSSFAPLDSAYFLINSPISTELELHCRWHKVFSEGSIKISRYTLTGKDIYSLPKSGFIEIKAGEMKFLTFQGKAGRQLTFNMEGARQSLCHVTSLSELPNNDNNRFNWDDATLAKFGGMDVRGKKVNSIVKLFTPTKTGTFIMVCNMFDGESGTMNIVLKDGSFKILGRQNSETTSPAKCPVAKAPNNAPKISVLPTGLLIEYTEPGLSDLAGCIDGFRVYAQTLNPFTKEVVQQNGTYSIQMKDCEKREKGLIVCLIPNEKPWLQTLNSQDASSNALAINASAVNSEGESEFSQYSFLFEKEFALISAACASMQASFATNMLIKTPIATVVGVGVFIAVGAIGSFLTGGLLTPFVVAAGTSLVAASIAKPVSARIFASIDKKAAKKFVETYPVTALELLISMKESSNPDVRATGETIQKAIQASDLMKVYRPLIGENNSLTDVEVAKILGDEKLSSMKEQEVSKFEKNGAKDVKSLFAKNPKIKVDFIKSVSKISQGVDIYMSISEQNQNNKSAVELIFPENCYFG